MSSSFNFRTSQFIFISCWKIYFFSHPPLLVSPLPHNFFLLKFPRGYLLVPFIYLQPLGHLAHGMILANTSLQDLDMKRPTQHHLRMSRHFRINHYFSYPKCPSLVVYLSQLLAIASFYLVRSEMVNSSLTTLFLLHILSNLPGKPGISVFKSNSSHNLHCYYPGLSQHLFLCELL